MAASNFTGGNMTFDQVRSRLDLAKMIIKHKYPLKMFDDELLKVFLKNLQPAFEFPSLDNMMADLLHVYRQEKQKLRRDLDNLSSWIHLVIYLWKDKPEDGKSFYLFLISRSINDDWELKEKILAVKELQYDTDAEALFQTFQSLISEWHIEKKICFTTVKYNSDIGIDKFNSLLSKQLSISCSSTGDRSFLECHVDQVLNGMDEILQKMRKSIRYANKKPDGTHNFLNAVRKAKFQMEEPSALVPKMSDDRFLTLERALQVLKCQKYYLHDFRNSLDALFGEYASVFGQAPPSASLSRDAQPASELQLYKDESNLPVPMSPYPSDSAISAEVMRIRKVFNDPNPEIVEALICTKDWLENA